MYPCVGNRQAMRFQTRISLAVSNQEKHRALCTQLASFWLACLCTFLNLKQNRSLRHTAVRNTHDSRRAIVRQLYDDQFYSIREKPSDLGIIEKSHRGSSPIQCPQHARTGNARLWKSGSTRLDQATSVRSDFFFSFI